MRKAVGDDFEIMVDGNQGAAVDEAIRRARLYEPFDLAWYEEPLPAEDLGGHIRLSASTSLPIAVGESIYSLSHFREYLQRDACSVVQVDVARIGGITPWLKTAHLAEAFNMAVCPHFLMELHVALTAAVPNGRWVEYIPQLDSLTTDKDDDRRWPRGAVRTQPGLGIAWDWEAIDRAAGRRLYPDRSGRRPKMARTRGGERKDGGPALRGDLCGAPRAHRGRQLSSLASCSAKSTVARAFQASRVPAACRAPPPPPRGAAQRFRGPRLP